MKRKLAILSLYAVIITITIFAVGLIIGPVIYWDRMSATRLNIWVADKTVPMPDYREHKGLMWILNHNKIAYSKTEDYFRYDKDYFGFFPVSANVYDTKEMPKGNENPDLIYVTDTYGVYTDDYLTPNVKGTISNMIYGGLSLEELNSIKTNIGNGNTVIGEFNIASAPTNRENRKELESIFGLQWTGWKGRYFKELARDIEVPARLLENYEAQQKQKWKFSGEGYVLVSDNDEVVVLEAKKDVGKDGLKIIFNNGYGSEFNVEKEIPYQYWFEFVKVKPGREAIANYKLDLTDKGKKIMEGLGLAGEFPAVTRYRNSQYTSYYFAGDFADIQNIRGIWKYYGFDKIKAFTSSFDKKSTDYFYWNCYVPMMNKIISDIKLKGQAESTHIVESENLKIFARTVKNSFQILKDGKWEDFFVKGVNIGAALPGKWFTDFPKDEEVYLDWFQKIGQMQANSIRIYTLLPPEFYNALEFYNRKHPEAPLWLFQEIWPEENPEGHDYLKKSYVDSYYKEIEYGIDAVHGKANIPERKGRAYGIYTSDVSKYVLGYLVGRELEPEEVETTNEKNAGFRYEGEYMSTEKTASPTEAWLAMNCDYVLKYEEGKYGIQHPVSIVSWPTLDVKEHDSEWNAPGLKSLEFNDKVSVNINNISQGKKMTAGFFGAYHIYPNYPDFINNEIKYNSYTDEEGRFRYGGYLKEFIETHTKYPALVAEFGLPTGMGNAHTSPDGYNHGAMTEGQQGEGIVRMMKAISREGYAGGLIFEWLDEWAKKTWITESYMIPYERHVLWHNALDPEQNYGLVAIESELGKDPEYIKEGNGPIRKISLKKDSTFLYLDINFDKISDFTTEKLLIGFDTYERNKGEFRFSPHIDVTAATGLEFLLEFSGQKAARILSHPGYNIANNKFSSYVSSKGVFEEIRPIINSKRVRKDGSVIEAIHQDGSNLNFGDFESNSYNHWYFEGNNIHIRIPWGKLNFTDPSSLSVLDDNTVASDLSRDKLRTVKTDGILISALLYDLNKKEKIDMLSTIEPYKWKEWEIPQYRERLKKSYFIIQDYFKKHK
jgi:hypothetical protein